MKKESYKRCRPNKIAVGMYYTHDRSKKSRDYLKDHCFATSVIREDRKKDVLSLIVKGTNDNLKGLSYLITRKKENKTCNHCGQKVRPRLMLNDTGRSKLKYLKKQKEKRDFIKKNGSEHPLLNEMF